MSVTRSQPPRRGLVRARFKPATSWQAVLLGDADSHVRINGEYIWVRVATGTSGGVNTYKPIVAYLDRRDVTYLAEDDLLPAAGTVVFIDPEASVPRVNVDQFWMLGA